MQKGHLTIIFFLVFLQITTSIKYSQSGKITVTQQFTISTQTNLMQSKIWIGTNPTSHESLKQLDFTIDIGSKTSWVNAQEYNPSESESFEDSGQEIIEFGDDDFHLKGNSASEAFYLQNLKADKVQFLTSIETFNPIRGDNGIALGRVHHLPNHDIASRLNEVIKEETTMFAIEYLSDTSSTTGIGNLYF